MKLNKFSFLLLYFLSPLFWLSAQSIEKGYYLFPISPGSENYLSGNMGELRSNHFHAGIDIKTNGVEGLPVYAAADGYISRIKISAWGYGNALYILHPNGETTVYAHLLKFSDHIQNFVRGEQYKMKTFEIELFPDKELFPVKRGEVIAYSGNTGGSGGPHLHFEIRDKNQEVLNPLKYGFSEIKDNIPPQIEKIALITLEKNARVNGLYGRFEFDIVRSGKDYQIKDKIAISGKVGIEILGYDRANGASNKNGIATIETNVDENTIFYQNISQFSFAETRDILVMHNYSVYQRTGDRFYKLYIDEGNKLPFYRKIKNHGALSLEDTAVHQISIHFWDSYENKSTLRFKAFNQEPPLVIEAKPDQIIKSDIIERYENILKISSDLQPQTSNIATIYANRRKINQDPGYIVGSTGFYLLDLSKGLPDSIQIGNETWQFNFHAKVPPTGAFSLYTPSAKIYFPKNALYDTLYIQTDYWQDEESEVFSISDDIFPLQRNIAVTLRPKLAYENKERTHVYSINDYGGHNFEGGEWQDMDIKFNTRNFGLFTLLLDTLAPVIKPLTLNSQGLKFVITDDRSGIHSYEAFLNGEWLLMHYDYKRSLIWSDRLNKNIPLEGELRLKVRDQAGNETIYKTRI